MYIYTQMYIYIYICLVEAQPAIYGAAADDLAPREKSDSPGLGLVYKQYVLSNNIISNTFIIHNQYIINSYIHNNC